MKQVYFNVFCKLIQVSDDGEDDDEENDNHVGAKRKGRNRKWQK